MCILVSWKRAIPQETSCSSQENKDMKLARILFHKLVPSATVTYYPSGNTDALVIVVAILNICNEIVNNYKDIFHLIYEHGQYKRAKYSNDC